MVDFALVLPDLKGGGAERRMLTLATRLQAKGYQVEFVLMQQQGELLADVPDVIPVACLHAPRTRHVLKTLRHYLKHRRPRYLIVNLWPLTVMAVLARLLSPVKPDLAIVECNNLTEQYRTKGKWFLTILRLSIRLTYPLADYRVTVSGGVADQLAALSGIARERFTVIYNPVRAAPQITGGKREQAEAIWQSGTAKRILTVGSFKPQKNHTLLLRAFAQLSKEREAVLMLLGEGALRATIEAEAASLGIAERVRLPGFHADPLAFYQTADVFVLSSNYEGLPNVLLEALACGTPIVSTNCPFGPEEILRGGQDGMLVPMEDATALARAMTAMLDHPSDPAQLRRRAADFSADAYAKRFIEMFGAG